MMKLKKIPYCRLIGILICFFVMSCKSTTVVGDGNDIEVLKKYKSLVVGGASDSRGVRIIIGVRNNNNLQIDSIGYHSKNQETNLITSESDTLWVDSYFYNRKKQVIGAENNEDWSSTNSCELFYRINGVVKQLNIPSLELKPDNVLWE